MINILDLTSGLNTRSKKKYLKQNFIIFSFKSNMKIVVKNSKIKTINSILTTMLDTSNL